MRAKPHPAMSLPGPWLPGGSGEKGGRGAVPAEALSWGRGPGGLRPGCGICGCSPSQLLYSGKSSSHNKTPLDRHGASREPSRRLIQTWKKRGLQAVHTAGGTAQASQRPSCHRARQEAQPRRPGAHPATEHAEKCAGRPAGRRGAERPVSLIPCVWKQW